MGNLKQAISIAARRAKRLGQCVYVIHTEDGLETATTIEMDTWFGGVLDSEIEGYAGPLGGWHDSRGRA